MKVNYYYSTAVEQTEDDLLHLCRECAAKHADRVQWASRGDEESECEFCDATNDPERTAHLNALFAKYAA
jgi:hypothetical protein